MPAHRHAASGSGTHCAVLQEAASIGGRQLPLGAPAGPRVCARRLSMTTTAVSVIGTREAPSPWVGCRTGLWQTEINGRDSSSYRPTVHCSRGSTPSVRGYFKDPRITVVVGRLAGEGHI